VLIVSSGSKCLDRTGREMFLRTCNGGQGQMWRVHNTGNIHSVVDNWCLWSDDPGKLLLKNDDCTNADRRFDDVGVNRNDRYLRNDDFKVCMVPIGDPAGENVVVRTNRGCTFTDPERWTIFKPVQPLQTVAIIQTDNGRVPATLPGVMLLVLALTLVQIRYRPRRSR